MKIKKFTLNRPDGETILAEDIDCSVSELIELAMKFKRN
jgi:hypothetical protein